MEDSNERRKMKLKVSIALLGLIAVLVTVMFADSVLAAPTGLAIGDRIGGFFNSYAANDSPQFLDFFLFTVIFFAVCWIGFSNVFKDAKNANVALSIAVGLALSIALVYGGKFTLKKLLPFAGTILFIVAIVLIYAFLKKFVFTSDTKMSKFLAFIFAIIIAVALFALLYHFICSGNNCENNAFMRKIFGSESIFGKFFKGLGSGWGSFSLGSGGGPSPLPLSTKCGNSVIEKNEVCDYKWDADGNPIALGCSKGFVCMDCKNCVEQHVSDTILGWISDNPVKVILVILLLVMGGLYLWKRKNVHGKLKRWWQKRQKRKELHGLATLLSSAEINERRILDMFRQLCESVKHEQGTMNTTKHIVDKITTDIKETIGQEIEFVKHTEVGPGGSIAHLVDQLVNFNNTEKHLVSGPDGIIDNIDQELVKIRGVPPELQNAINELESADLHMDEHSDLLETFKQHNFREKNIITNMLERIDNNRKGFESISDACDRMVNTLHGMLTDATGIAGVKQYEDILKNIRAMRDHAIKLNQLFAAKINMLHYLSQKMKELHEEVKSIHEEERKSAKDFMSHAQIALGSGKMDTAVYYALHAIENAEELKKAELDQNIIAELNTVVFEAKQVIRQALPNLYSSIRETIRTELMEGKYAQVREMAIHAKKLKYMERYRHEFEPWLHDFEHKMDLLVDMCDKLMAGAAIQRNLHIALGL
ncbi:hypothetical protein KY363_01885 [Candidatus Woesearchaeota archaeon]|nr:hypothetical protein [Candidatus Woesearchaeota archaeon]